MFCELEQYALFIKKVSYLIAFSFSWGFHFFLTPVICEADRWEIEYKNYTVFLPNTSHVTALYSFKWGFKV